MNLQQTATAVTRKRREWRMEKWLGGFLKPNLFHNAIGYFLLALIGSLAAFTSASFGQGSAPSAPFTGWMKYYPYLSDTSKYRLPRSGGTTFNGRFLKYIATGPSLADTTGWSQITLTTDVTGILPTGNGGTGPSMTNGQLLIGDGSGVPTVATLTAGTNVSITNGAGSITINSTGTKIRYVDDGTLDYNVSDTIDIRVGGGMGFFYDPTPSIDSLRIFIDIDGSTLDTGAIVGGNPGQLKVKTAGITANELGNNSVVGGAGGDVSDNSLTADDIANNAITSNELADGAVSGGAGGKITDATIVNEDVADDNLDATSLAPGACATSEILNQTIIKDDVDSTASNFVFDGAYEGTSGVADSQYATKGFVDRGGDETKYIGSWYAYGTLVPPTDSITLSLPLRSGNIHYLFSDSTNQGNDTDRVDCVIEVPSDFDLDSIALAYITSSATADSSQVDSCEVWGPTRTSGTNASDSVWHQENVAYAGTSLTRVAFAIDESINAGDRFAVRFKNVLKQDNAFVRIAWVQFVGKER